MDDPKPPVALPPGVFTRGIALEVSGMGDIVRHADVAAGDTVDAPAIDIYRPGAGGPHPAIVFVPGGPVPAPAVAKDWGVFTSYGRAAAALGFVGVTVSHRFHEVTDVEAASARVSCVLEWIRAHAHDVGCDPDRLAVWAFSGAGTLIPPLIRKPPEGLRALVLFYAGLDVRAETAEADPSMKRWSAVAALEAAARWTIPMVVARAGLDAAPLNAALDRFVARALAINAPLDVLTHPTGRHGFDVFDHDARSRDIIARTFAVIRRATG